MYEHFFLDSTCNKAGSMTLKQWMLAVCFSLASVFWTGESAIAETQTYTCRTFGSGVIQPFNGSAFYVRSNCPFTFTRFTHNSAEYDITVRRGDSGLLVQVEIIINKVRTVLQNGSILVEKTRVSLPYDHTYQHIFQYGIYTRLKSLLLPLSVTWHDVPGGIDTLKVELEQELSTDMSGLCGKHNVAGKKQQLITESVLTEDTCQIRDVDSTSNMICQQFFSYTLDCLQAKTPHYIKLCEYNAHSYEGNTYISCAFFKEIALQCGNSSYVWNVWRPLTGCAPPTCPGDLVYAEEGTAFVPSCSNPNPRVLNQDVTSSCACQNGKVLNDHADGFHCMMPSSCSCVFAGRSYFTGEIRSTKCQSCLCDGGNWRCSENLCPPRCVIEGQFVTTFDGKKYGVPGKCTYVASQGQNWTITVEFSQKEASLRTVTLQLFQETYTFTHNKVTFGAQEITELHQSDHALLYWCSSMFVHVHTSFGMKIQIQVSPEIQLYITIPGNHKGMISGICGNSNNDTTDDFTTSSGIIENSAQLFTLSWSVGTCVVNIPNTCINTDNEIFADGKCSVLNNPDGIFAECHGHIAPDQYHTACIQRTCNCGSNLQQCLCVALGSYAKACASLGVKVGDWRKATNCTLKCPKNQEFSYAQACIRSCRSLSGPNPCCELEDGPVEGCGCPEGTHLNQGQMCTPKAECPCYYHGGMTPPGPVVIDGRQCLCEDGQLHCSKECGCTNGKVCVHCSENPINTAQKTCDSLSKPLAANLTCESGCYCPHDQYEDHRGNCVSRDNCTCVYSGKVFSAGQQVKTNCKTCTCGQGQWHCKKEQCPGMCQVYGNGHYQTFDSKWYRFDGHCQYTLVEDYCGSTNGTFSVRVESVPCCDEALTCSRSIIVELQSKVTLTLSDMRVTKRIQTIWTEQQDPLYTTHTVGLYIIISVPSSGMTLIWDKHTRITIELHANWRNKVCGLCGNFDSNEMNDLQMRGSAVVSGLMAFGNSWKAASPPCSDVTTEIFPCERNSYCSAWAQRRCMILMGDTFRDCHLKVDPEPYYHACVQESCSCEFEGKFLGFCTAVAAYAEACSDQEVCINWRTPDLCPVYCDYYNEKGQCSWHYEACGKMLSCGKGNFFSHTLEGCYPRCPKEAPYYDENIGVCTTLRNCTCYFNDTVIQSGTVVTINSFECPCENGTINCPAPPTTTPAPTTAASTTTVTTLMTSTVSPTAETTTHGTTTTPTAASTTTEIWTTIPTSTTPTSVITTTSPTTSTTTAPSTTTTTTPTTTEIWTTVPTSTTSPTASTTSKPTTTATSTTALSTPTAAPTTTEIWTPTSTTPTSVITTISPTTSTKSTLPTTLTTTETRTTMSITTTSTQTTPAPSTTTPSTPTAASITTETQTTMPTSTIATSTITATSPTTSTKSTPATTLTTTETGTTMSIPTTFTQTTPAPSTTTTTTPTTTEIWTTVPTSTTPTSVITTISPTTSTNSKPTITATSTTTPSTPTAASITTETQTTMPTSTMATSTITATSPTTSTKSTPATTLTTSVTVTTMSIPTTFTQTTPAPSTTTTATPTAASTTTEIWTTMPTSTTSPTTSTNSTPTATATSTVTPTTTSTLMTTITTDSSTTSSLTTTEPPPCECPDRKRIKSWACGETWTEDCFHKKCTYGKIEMIPVACPEPVVPTCPRGQAVKVSDGCCDTWRCDCRCELYGDPHYISFQGVPFDFLDECTYILVEEQSPRYHLTIVVDNFFCVSGLQGSCAKGIIMKYQNNNATLSIIPYSFAVQATLNNVTIQPPYEEHGFRFETTEYEVSIHLPEIRSFVSLTPSYTLVINLAMEHFVNNTQGQCGVCGGASCIRKGGHIEDDSCCDKTAYDWVYPDNMKPACVPASMNVPCGPVPTSPPTLNPPCPSDPICELLHHPVFANCSNYVNLILKKKNCEFDSCRNSSGSCSSLEQAAEECKQAGFCIDWRGLTNGSCDVPCPEGLVYKECPNKLDDFCYGGVLYPGPRLAKNSPGCFCPHNLSRAGNHSHACVPECNFCKGPNGEPRFPGEEWESNCNLCKCNNQTRTEECSPKPVPTCPTGSIVVDKPCCGGQTCVEKTCTYHGKTYKVGSAWKDSAQPCLSFICSTEGIQTTTRVCPSEICPEEDRIWDDQHCCFTCNQSCAPKVSSINITIDNCTSVIHMPVCQGQCVSQPRVVLHGDLQVEQESRCCREQSSKKQSVTLQCLDLTTRQYTYKHITSCECRGCTILR